MKKLKLACMFLAMGAFTVGCSGDDDSNPVSSCEDTSAATAVAAQAYVNATDAEHSAACNAYKVALQNQINSCGDTSGALQAMIDDLGDCTLNANPGAGVISVTVGGARTFETNIEITDNGDSYTIYAEDGGTTNWISMTVADGATGASAISDFEIHIGTSDYIPLAVSEGGNFTSNVTVNSATNLNGTFFGYVTSPVTGADLDLTSGVIDIDL